MCLVSALMNWLVEILKEESEMAVSMIDGHDDKITNYERIKNMSVEEMAGLIVDFHFVFQCKSYGLDPKTIYESMNEEDKKICEIKPEQSDYRRRCRYLLHYLLYFFLI